MKGLFLIMFLVLISGSCLTTTEISLHSEHTTIIEHEGYIFIVPDNTACSINLENGTMTIKENHGEE